MTKASAPPTANDARDTILSIYVALMQQVVLRLDAMAESLAEAVQNPEHENTWQNAEFCYLQIRKTCEYVALAVLVSHKIYSENDLIKSQHKYHAADIFKEILKFNKYAFPVPFAFNAERTTASELHADRVELSLQAEDLNRIYGACGDRLHVGSLRRLLNGKAPPFDLKELNEWRNVLVGTLSNHVVQLPHVGAILLVTLKSYEDGEVRCVLAEANGPYVIGTDPTVFAADREQ